MSIYYKLNHMSTKNNVHDLRFKAIANLLTEWRRSQGLSQLELCNQGQLHRNTVQRAENGKNITLLSLFMIVDALDISPKEIFLDIE